MGTLKVDNLQKRDGTALITDGAATVNLLSESALRTTDVGMVKLLTSTSSSGVANFDIDSTYINSTYDNYRIIAGFTFATDNTTLYTRFFVGGSIVEANYCYENGANTSSTYNYDSLGGTYMQLAAAFGNATGETVTAQMDLTNVNSTSIATRLQGQVFGGATNGNTVGYNFQAGQDINSYNSVVNGLRFYMSSGNIIMNHFAIYGLVK